MLSISIPEEVNIFHGESREWTREDGVILDKPAIEVRETEECFYVLKLSLCRPVLYSFSYLGIHLETFHCEDECQVLDRGLVEAPFLAFDVKAGVAQGLKDFAYVVLMFLQHFRVYYNLVKVGCKEAVQVQVENIIN